jgi:hypothetical protein
MAEKDSKSPIPQEVIANIDGIGKLICTFVWNGVRIVYSENIRKKAALMCKSVIIRKAQIAHIISFNKRAYQG